MLTCILLHIDFLENIRLMNGMSVNEGRVQILLDGVWGTVCSIVWWNEFDTHTAHIACRELGFSNVSTYWKPFASENMTPVILEHLNCTGNEQSIMDCPHSRYRDIFEKFSCGTNVGNVVSVICLRKLWCQSSLHICLHS